ncbi:hypothetical protein NSQ91_10630 [Paenibacillus sp. FSL R7-0048]|nr:MULTISPECIES: hypothetical protein [Paenibacillus]MDH6426426.1 hypothetical protein [Paenibacillus sp. PastH-4]MDH6442449.1 hypothetical protein [Paenibacillus sp. PastF-4]MDH6526838.1 hypothetical protein [Paenibacillus sp. PastH-3]
MMRRRNDGMMGTIEVSRQWPENAEQRSSKLTGESLLCLLLLILRMKRDRPYYLS